MIRLVAVLTVTLLLGVSYSGGSDRAMQSDIHSPVTMFSRVDYARPSFR